MKPPCPQLRELFGELTSVHDNLANKIAEAEITRNSLDVLKQKENLKDCIVKTKERVLISKYKEVLSKAFQKKVIVENFPPEFTYDNLKKWEGYNLKPVYFSEEKINKSRRLANWVRPHQLFYEKIEIEAMPADALKLKKGWYLIDVTSGMNATIQSIWDYALPNDRLVGEVIAGLRRENKIPKSKGIFPNSRFGLTLDEWQKIVLPALAKKLGLNPEQIHLERYIEFNAIGNLYDSRRGEFKMMELFSDDIGLGGNFAHGGNTEVI